MIEYRLRWSASSNITFHGETDWQPWHDDDATVDEVEEALYGGKQECEGLSEVLEVSGFEWDIETRETESG